MFQKGLRYTPTPVISHAILTYNRAKGKSPADGAVITSSHNPPEDGGFKYNPPEGGPASPETTRIIEVKANKIIEDGLRPSGTEDICKIYAESFRSEEHLKSIQQEAMAIIEAAYRKAGV